MEREPARRYRAVGEGVFSSAFRKFKSLRIAQNYQYKEDF
jgi:hypothetical protein